MANDRNASGLTKREEEARRQEYRANLIGALRHFQVRVPVRGSNQTALVGVMAHRLMFGTHGILQFITETEDAAFTRRAFRFWLDVEEIVTPDGGKSTSGKEN